MLSKWKASCYRQSHNRYNVRSVCPVTGDQIKCRGNFFIARRLPRRLGIAGGDILVHLPPDGLRCRDQFDRDGRHPAGSHDGGAIIRHLRPVDHRVGVGILRLTHERSFTGSRALFRVRTCRRRLLDKLALHQDSHCGCRRSRDDVQTVSAGELTSSNVDTSAIWFLGLARLKAGRPERCCPGQGHLIKTGGSMIRLPDPKPGDGAPRQPSPDCARHSPTRKACRRPRQPQAVETDRAGFGVSRLSSRGRSAGNRGGSRRDRASAMPAAWCRVARTSLSGGALPLADAVVVGLMRMNQILDISAADRLRRAGGVTNIGISNEVSDEGFFHAPDPSNSPPARSAATST